MKMFLSQWEFFDYTDGLLVGDEINQPIETLLHDYNKHAIAYDRQSQLGLLSKCMLILLTKLLQHAPEHEALLLRRSFYYETHDMAVEAFADILTLLEARPDSLLAKRNWYRLSQSNKDKNFMTLVGACCSSKSLSAKLLIDRYKFYLNNEQTELALVDLNTLLLKEELLHDPLYRDNYLSALSQRSYILYKKNRYDAALEDLNKLINNLPIMSECRYLSLVTRAKIYYQQKSYNQALRDLSECINYGYPTVMDGEDTESLLYLRSTIYKHQGMPRKEMDDLNQVLLEFPNHIEARQRREEICRNNLRFTRYDPFSWSNSQGVEFRLASVEGDQQNTFFSPELISLTRKRNRGEVDEERILTRGSKSPKFKYN